MNGRNKKFSRILRPQTEYRTFYDFSPKNRYGPIPDKYSNNSNRITAYFVNSL